MGGIFQLIGGLLTIYQFIVFARVLMSWIPDLDRSHPIAQFLYDVTEPVLRPIREALPPQNMGMDFSPMILLVGIYVLRMIFRM